LLISFKAVQNILEHFLPKIECYTPAVKMDFSPYAAVLLDLDGTVYYEDHALPGAIEFIRHLQQSNINFACLSNGATSPARVSERLAVMGVKLDPARIYTAAAAACDYVLYHLNLTHRPRVLNLCTEGVQEMLEGKVDWVNADTELCDAIIIGAPSNSYATEPRQRIALRLLRNGAAAVAICADRIYPSPRGLEFGSGAFTAMLSYAADVTPIYCGKPERIFFHELCDRLKVDPAKCILVGDNLESDIAGGKNVGMKTVLTLTGVAHRSDLPELPPNRQPDWVLENLAELI
jgi:4-nitrophenyl phosphatase